MAERKFCDVEKPFSLLLDGVKDFAIIVLDNQGQVVGWNAGAERLLGYSEDKIVGQPFTCIFTPEDIQNGVPDRELQEARAAGQVRTERWHLRKDGSRCWASGSVTALWEDTFQGYAKVMRDQTAQKLAQDGLHASVERSQKRIEELERLHQRKDRFLAMLSHELRNPLATVLTALEVLRQERTDNPLQLQARNILERQVHQLTHLVDDLLEISRLTVGKIHLRKEPVELRLVVEHAKETAQPQISARQHPLALTLPEQPVWCQGDPTRLEQVVVNLLTNAAKYTPLGGDIFLSLCLEHDEAVVRVRDQGMGIAPELLPHIFDLFTQAEHGQDGLGIGLALVKALVEMHEGSVVARSEGVGRGSEFVVRLPVCAPPHLGRALLAVPASTGPACQRILVVEDNLDAAYSLAMLLRLKGHQVWIANTGPTAMQEALNCVPHVVLLDIGLPGMSGYEVAKQLRGQAATRRAVLIAMTGYGQEADKERARALGFDHYLVKPVDPTELQNVLALWSNRG